MNTKKTTALIEEQWIKETREYEISIRDKTVKELCNNKSVSQLRYSLRVLLDHIKTLASHHQAEIARMKEEQAEEICKLIDDIELSYKSTSLEEWKAFKHIRNEIRDRYE